MALKIFACLFVGYLLGNIQTGYFIGKIKKIDIREHGSGNAGTTNAFRTLGRKAGFITFLGDFLKVFIPLLLIRYVIFPDCEYYKLLQLVLGFGCVLGHNFPFYLGFKGGKGIAVTSGVFLAFDYWILIPGLLLFFSIVLITKYVSVASLSISLLFPIWIAVRAKFFTDFYPQQDPAIYRAMVFTGILFFIMALIRHWPNIQRLKAGTENKIGQHAKV